MEKAIIEQQGKIFEMRVGRMYEIIHVRKGIFHGKLVDIVSCEPDDPQDKIFLQMEIDTGLKTGSPRISILPAHKAPQITITNIRPSLVTKVADWVPPPPVERMPVIQEEKDEVQEMQEIETGWLRRILNRIIGE